MPNFEKICHADHGLNDDHRAFVMNQPDIAALPDGTLVKQVFELPAGLRDLKCALYGPAVGDDPVETGVTIRFSDGWAGPGSPSFTPAYWEVRGDRKGPSRLVRANPRSTRRLVIIGIKGELCFTAYGTRADAPSPREPWDADRKCDAGIISEDERQEAHDFWRVHALSTWG